MPSTIKNSLAVPATALNENLHPLDEYFRHCLLSQPWTHSYTVDNIETHLTTTIITTYNNIAPLLTIDKREIQGRSCSGSDYWGSRSLISFYISKMQKKFWELRPVNNSRHSDFVRYRGYWTFIQSLRNRILKVAVPMESFLTDRQIR